MFHSFTVLAMRGNSGLRFLFMSTNAGDSELAFGVVLRSSRATSDLFQCLFYCLYCFFCYSVALRVFRTRCRVSEVVYFSKFTKLP